MDDGAIMAEAQEPETSNALPRGAQKFTITPINLDSPEIAAQMGDAPLEVIEGASPKSRPLNEVVRPSVGCISEDENRERMAHALTLDVPSISALKGKYSGQKLILCGGGPSLKDTLPGIKAQLRDENVKLMAVNKTAAWLLDQGVVADFCVLMDPRAHIPDYLVPHERTKYLLGAGVDRRAFEICKASQAYLWFPIGTSRDAPFMHEQLQTKYPWKSVALIPGPSTVGLRSIYLGMDILGFTSVELHGMDSCYAPNGGALWSYAKNVTFEPVKVDFTVVSKTDGALLSCISNPDMARQVYEFDSMIQSLIGSVKAGRRPFLPNITVAGDGAIPWMAWKNKGHATPERMKAKYGDAMRFDYSTGKAQVLFTQISHGDALAHPIEIGAPIVTNTLTPAVAAA